MRVGKKGCGKTRKIRSDFEVSSWSNDEIASEYENKP